MLGLLWIIAQIPRKNMAGAYRLHDVGSQGFTLCDPSVLAAAVENQINTLPGVVTSAALLRGTAKAPDLTLKVTVNDRADVRDLIHRIQTSTLPELSNAWTRPCSAAGCRSTSADESKAPEPLCIPRHRRPLAIGPFMRRSVPAGSVVVCTDASTPCTCQRPPNLGGPTALSNMGRICAGCAPVSSSDRAALRRPVSSSTDVIPLGSCKYQS